MLKDFFYKKRKYATIPSEKAKKNIPDGMVVKCEKCGTITFVKELQKNLNVCLHCSHHHSLSAPERLLSILDDGHFFEYDSDLASSNPLGFEGYLDKLKKDMDKTNLNEAVVVGEGTIGGFPAIVGVMDSRFRMGSMGSVVGEKIAAGIERALVKKYPFILFSASGGARMQEGILSLMQMAKTSAALAKLHQEGILFISVLTNPTTGGVSASFASLGDINIAEPGALIGFAGPRVIEQVIRQKLPEGFQTSEFLLNRGQIDMIVDRKEMKSTLEKLLELHMVRGNYNG